MSPDNGLAALKIAAKRLVEAEAVDLVPCAAHRGRWDPKDCDCNAKGTHLDLAEKALLRAARTYAKAVR